MKVNLLLGARSKIKDVKNSNVESIEAKKEIKKEMKAEKDTCVKDVKQPFVDEKLVKKDKDSRQLSIEERDCKKEKDSRQGLVEEKSFKKESLLGQKLKMAKIFGASSEDESTTRNSKPPTPNTSAGNQPSMVQIPVKGAKLSVDQVSSDSEPEKLLESPALESDSDDGLLSRPPTPSFPTTKTEELKVASPSKVVKLDPVPLISEQVQEVKPKTKQEEIRTKARTENRESSRDLFNDFTDEEVSTSESRTKNKKDEQPAKLERKPDLHEHPGKVFNQSKEKKMDTNDLSEAEVKCKEVNASQEKKSDINVSLKESTPEPELVVKRTVISQEETESAGHALLGEEPVEATAPQPVDSLPADAAGSDLTNLVQTTPEPEVVVERTVISQEETEEPAEATAPQPVDPLEDDPASMTAQVSHLLTGILFGKYFFNFGTLQRVKFKGFQS